MRSYLLALTTAASVADSKIPADFGGSHPNGSQLMAGHLSDVHQVSVGTSKLTAFFSEEFSWTV